MVLSRTPCLMYRRRRGLPLGLLLVSLLFMPPQAGPVVPSSDVSVGSPSAWDQEQDPLTALMATAARGVTEDLPVDAMIITGSHVLFTEYLEDVREALEVAGPTCEIEECVETGVAVVRLDFKRLETRLETGDGQVMGVVCI